jgi:hypothetical protein
MTDFTADEMLAIIHRSLDENAARFRKAAARKRQAERKREAAKQSKDVVATSRPNGEK